MLVKYNTEKPTLTFDNVWCTVVKRLRCGRIFEDHFIATLLLCVRVEYN